MPDRLKAETQHWPRRANVKPPAGLVVRDYLDHNTEYGWYLCLEGDQIVAGMGVIENDFHDRKDLKLNV